MPEYDYIMAGGGAAGLSLAFHLSQSDLAHRRVLIVDKDRKQENDRTWCFWTSEPTAYDSIIYRRWPTVRFTSSLVDLSLDLDPLRYCMLRGIDFYTFVRERLGASKHVDFLTSTILAVEDGGDEVVVRTSSGDHTAEYAFDSIFIPEEFQVNTRKHHFLFQHFRGWVIRTERDVFDPNVATMFDFRVLPGDGMRFMYLLPFSSRRSLVEYTVFSPRLLPEAEYLEGIRRYLSDVLEVVEYEIEEYEKGVIPMTEQPFPRKDGHRIMRIGTKAGMVKGSTGFAFHRTQRDSLAIVDSLQSNGHPFGVPASPARYRVLDAMLLHVLQKRPELAEKVFSDLFGKNPVDRLFRFLDENSTPREDLALMSTVPWGPFIRAGFEIALGRVG